jgi:hypothetical protein
MLAERLVEQARGVAGVAVHHRDLHALVAQDPEPAAGRLDARVVARDHHAGDPRGHDGVGARWRTTVVRTRLEGDVHGRAGGVLAARAQRLALGVRLACGVVEALADRAPVLDDDGAHERVRAGVPARLGSQLDGPHQVALVVLRGQCLSRQGAVPGS